MRTRTLRAGDNRDGAGFTLLELMLVLTLIAVVMAVVITRLPTGATATEAAACARQLATGLKRAQGEAIRGNQEVAFTLNVAKRFYQIADRPSVQLPGNLSLALYTAASEAISEEIGSIRFFPDGSSTGGRVHVRHPGQKKDAKVVTIDWVTGRVTIND